MQGNDTGCRIKIGVIQCMEKISEDKIPFRDEALLAQQTRGEKVTKQVNVLFYLGSVEQMVPQNYKFGAPQFTQQSQLLRVQMPTEYNYFPWSKGYWIRSKGGR